MNRRQAARFVYVEVMERFDLDGKTLMERGTVLDISETGVLFKGNVPLQVGEQFKFRFEIGGEYFFVEGLVMRVGTHNVDKKPLSGVKLLLTQAQRERLSVVLARSGKKPLL